MYIRLFVVCKYLKYVLFLFNCFWIDGVIRNVNLFFFKNLFGSLIFIYFFLSFDWVDVVVIWWNLLRLGIFFIFNLVNFVILVWLVFLNRIGVVKVLVKMFFFNIELINDVLLWLLVLVISIGVIFKLYSLWMSSVNWWFKFILFFLVYIVIVLNKWEIVFIFIFVLVDVLESKDLVFFMSNDFKVVGEILFYVNIVVEIIREFFVFVKLN